MLLPRESQRVIVVEELCDDGQTAEVAADTGLKGRIACERYDEFYALIAAQRVKQAAQLLLPPGR